MVMTMYSLLNTNPSPSEKEIEDQFDGNLCRCTGYRSIFTAMKSVYIIIQYTHESNSIIQFAPNNKNASCIGDIEELVPTKVYLYI
jgi:xanthine dehydrogenase iron-sulfur cluster and FAD-binding subunit A